MDIHFLFFSLALVIFFGRVIGDFLNKFGIPIVIGEILTGIILGVSGFGIIQPNDAIKFLAEIGIILFLFKIGLESDIHKLKKVGIPAFIVSFVAASSLLIFISLVSYYIFNFDIKTSLFLGGTFTATSIGITVKVLTDLNLLNQRFAQIVLAAAVLDDIFGVVILSILHEFIKTGNVELNIVAKIIFYVIVFFMIAPIIIKILAKIIDILSDKLKSEVFIPSSVISMIFLFAFLSYKLGLPEILGSFTVGLALSQSFVINKIPIIKIEEEKIIKKIEHSIEPLVYTLTPIFFVNVGLNLNLRSIDFMSLEFWKIAIVLLFLIFIGKLISGFFIRGSLKEKLLIGFSMLPGGEVCLIFAEFGKQMEIFDNLIYAIIIFIVAFISFIAPLLLKLLAKSE